MTTEKGLKKHEKYFNQYGKNELYWGLGIKMKLI